MDDTEEDQIIDKLNISSNTQSDNNGSDEPSTAATADGWVEVKSRKKRK